MFEIGQGGLPFDPGRRDDTCALTSVISHSKSFGGSIEGLLPGFISEAPLPRVSDPLPPSIQYPHDDKDPPMGDVVQSFNQGFDSSGRLESMMSGLLLHGQRQSLPLPSSHPYEQSHFPVAVSLALPSTSYF